MIGITEFINESAARSQYGVLLDRLEFNKIPNLSKLTTMIKSAIEQANNRYKIIRVEAIEKLNASRKEYDNIQLKKALAQEEQRVIAYMKTKPGIMRRSEEKQRKYIDDKIEKFKSAWKGPRLAAVEYDEKELRFSWHDDVHSEHSSSQLNDDRDTVADRVAKDIDSKRNDSTWSHLTGIDIAVNNSELTSDWCPRFEIIPMFDDETEKKLSKSVRNFSDFMDKQYNSGNYMGD